MRWPPRHEIVSPRHAGACCEAGRPWRVGAAEHSAASHVSLSTGACGRCGGRVVRTPASHRGGLRAVRRGAGRVPRRRPRCLCGASRCAGLGPSASQIRAATPQGAAEVLCCDSRGSAQTPGPRPRCLHALHTFSVDRGFQAERSFVPGVLGGARRPQVHAHHVPRPVHK